MQNKKGRTITFRANYYQTVIKGWKSALRWARCVPRGLLLWEGKLGCKKRKKLRNPQKSLKSQNGPIIGVGNGVLGERFWCNSSGVGLVIYHFVKMAIAKRWNL